MQARPHAVDARHEQRHGLALPQCAELAPVGPQQRAAGAAAQAFDDAALETRAFERAGDLEQATQGHQHDEGDEQTAEAKRHRRRRD